MVYKPVISPEDAVMVALCPRCNGSFLCVVEKYVSRDDLESFERQKGLGFVVKKIKLKDSKSLNDCACKPLNLKPKIDEELKAMLSKATTSRPIEPPKAKTSSRGILSLSSKRSTTSA